MKYKTNISMYIEIIGRVGNVEFKGFFKNVKRTI